MLQVNTKVSERQYKWLKSKRDKRYLYMYGGASSSKSHSIAQYLIVEKAFKEKNIGILVVRKTRPAVHTSCWPLIHNWLNEMELPYVDNKSDLTITTPGGNFFMFDGLDNIFKKKSIEGINYVWIEEAAGLHHDAIITLREFMHLDIICRSKNSNGKNQIFSSFNPVDPIGNKWLVDKVSEANPVKDNSAVLQVTHWDNPFLQDEEHETIEAMADQDAEFDKIYRKGEWATPTAIIYTNWDIVSTMTEQYDDVYWGLDFGYSINPAALVEMRIAGNEVWERQWIYETGLTNPQLIDKMKQIIANRNQIIMADSAEPKSIQEIRNAGFNIHPVKKGPDSVRYGINAVKSVKTHLFAESTDLIEEKQTYKWKVDRDETVLQEPAKFHDHLMDAERYVMMRLKGKVKAGISFDPDPEKAEHIIPDTREKMLADRYGELETVPKDDYEREFNEEDQWKEV